MKTGFNWYSTDTMHSRVFFGTKRLVTRLTIAPFRVMAYVLHATGLDHIYKPRFERHSALSYLTDEFVAKLPKHSLSITGARMDPMNLIVVGTEQQIKRTFKEAGWRSANPASPVHLLYGLATVMTGRSYESGPFTPHYVNIGLQDFAYQKQTFKRSFSQRHHLRIWRTGTVLPDGKRIWLATSSFDTALKVQLTPPFIHHEIDPDIDGERDFIVRSLEDNGAYRLKSISMLEPIAKGNPRSNAYGAKYFTDGKAVVVEV